MATLLNYALTDLASVKETLGIDAGNTSKDNLIIRKINLATHVIETWCNLPRDHHFKSATYTQEVYDGNGIDQLVLKMRPVTALSSFQHTTTSENQNDWDDVESTLYFLDEDAGTLDLLFGQNRNWSAYRATYTAGYSTIPVDLAEAAATLAAFWTENSTAGTTIKRKREGQREVEYFNAFGGSGGSNDSVIESLGLDEILQRYKFYAA